MRDISLENLRRYVESVTEEKIAEMKLTRRDLRAILMKLDEACSILRQCIDGINTLLAGQKGLASTLRESTSEISEMKKIVSETIRDRAGEILSLGAKTLSEISKILQTLSSMRVEHEKTTTTISSIAGFAKDILAGLRKTMNDIGALRDAAARAREELAELSHRTEKIRLHSSETLKGLSSLGKRLDQFSETISSLGQSVAELSVSLKAISDNIGVLLGVIDGLRSDMREIRGTLCDVLRVVMELRKAMAMQPATMEKESDPTDI